MQNQLKSIDAYKNQSEIYKKQIQVIEEKLKVYENESNIKASQLTNQLKNVRR